MSRRYWPNHALPFEVPASSFERVVGHTDIGESRFRGDYSCLVACCLLMWVDCAKRKLDRLISRSKETEGQEDQSPLSLG